MVDGEDDGKGADTGAEAGGDAGKGGGAEGLERGGSLLREAAADPGAEGAGKGAEGEAGKAADAKAWQPPADLPENLRGTTPEETLAKVSKAWLGARQELSKKGQSAAPKTAEEYAFDAKAMQLPEGVRVFATDDPKDDPVFQTARSVAHKHGLSQAQFQGFIADFMGEIGKAGVLAPAFDSNAEWEKLGGKARGMAVARDVVQWGKSLNARGALSEADVKLFEDRFGDAAGVRLASILMALSGEKPIPTMGLADDSLPSDAELYAMRGDPKMKSDPAFREKVERLFQKRWGNEPASRGPSGLFPKVAA